MNAEIQSPSFSLPKTFAMSNQILSGNPNIQSQGAFSLTEMEITPKQFSLSRDQKAKDKSSVFEGANLRKGYIKRLKDEMEECATKLQKPEFSKELKQECYGYIIGKIDKHYDEYGNRMDNQLKKLKSLIETLVSTDENSNMNNSVSEQHQKILFVEGEYKRLLENLEPPMLELIKKNELNDIKTELNKLKRDKYNQVNVTQKLEEQGKNDKEKLEEYFQKIQEQEQTIYKLEAILNETRTGRVYEPIPPPNPNKDANTQNLMKIVKRINNKASELSKGKIGDPLSNLKSELLHARNEEIINKDDDIEAILEEIDHKLEEGISSVKLMEKARKDMNEKMVNQLLVSNTSDIYKLQSNHAKEIEGLKQNEAKQCEENKKIKETNNLLEEKLTSLKNEISDYKIKNEKSEDQLKKQKAKLEELKGIEKEKEGKEQLIMSLRSEIETIKMDVKGRLESENQNLKKEIEKLNEETKSLYKFRDNFEEAQKDKYAEIEAKHQKHIELVHAMCKEKIDQMRSTMEKSARESEQRVKGVKDQCNEQISLAKKSFTEQVKVAKGEIKKEEESTRMEYVDKLNQLKAQEQTVFMRSTQLLINK